MRLARLLIFAGAVVMMQGAVKTVSADGSNSGTMTLAPGLTANATLTTTSTGPSSGTWTLTFDVVNTSANTVDINSFALQLFGAGAGESFTITSETVNGSPSLGPWQFFDDDKLNNGSSPVCNAADSAHGWACGDTGAGGSLNPFNIASGKTLVITLSGTFTDTNGLPVFDLMASGCTDAGACKVDGPVGNKNSNNDKWAVSGPMTDVASTPEPASLLLLGTGMSAVGLIRRRKQA